MVNNKLTTICMKNICIFFDSDFIFEFVDSLELCVLVLILTLQYFQTQKIYLSILLSVLIVSSKEKSILMHVRRVGVIQSLLLDNRFKSVEGLIDAEYTVSNKKICRFYSSTNCLYYNSPYPCSWSIYRQFLLECFFPLNK